MIVRTVRSRRVAFALTLLITLVGASLPGWAQFETRATAIMPQQGALSIAGGDFNHDGYFDVVIIDYNGFTVSLGKGDGTFQKAVCYPTPQITYSVAVGDFNNDGNLDIVFANLYPSTVTVYLGNGDGTFKTPVDSNTTVGSYFVTVGDFNNDKKLDLAIEDPPYISVLLGNGDGTFQAPSDNGSFSYGIWLAVGDFNNDHKLDVIATGYSGAAYNVAVLMGNGDGTVQESIITPIEYVPASVAAGDLNGDGYADAILGYALDGIAVLLGNGDGTFQPAVNYNTTGIGGDQIVASDLNLDGRLDVVVPNSVLPGALPTELGVDIFWGNGDGTLQPAQFFAAGDAGGIAVGDLNGDHLPDLTLANSLAGAITLLNTGVASFSPNTAPLAFLAQLVNTVSPTQRVTLTNTGAVALSISSIRVSGPFQMSNTCRTSVGAGANCSISARFEPKKSGTFTGLVTIVDSASSKPQYLELTASATVVKLSPTSLNFGTQQVGKKSVPRSVTATNEGTAAIMFSSVGVSVNQKDFASTGNCANRPIQPGTSCEMQVTFDPTKTGTRSADLYFNLPTGAISPLPVPLSGSGVN
jgi:hypothetical protein